MIAWVLIAATAALGDWSVSVGARTGDGKASIVETGEALRLRGDAETGIWRMAARPLNVEAGRCVRLSLEARALDLRREGRQFQNHFTAVATRSGRELRWVHRPVWTPEQFIVRGDGAPAQVQAFLSMSGTLEVRAMRVEWLKPDDSYDVLVDHMDRYYSYFAHKKIDWKALARKHRGDVRALLAELRDPHVWIARPSGERVVPWRRDVPPVDLRPIRRGLNDVRPLGDIGITGRTKEGFGYIAIGSMRQTPDLFEPIEALLDAPGIILDLRVNGGGDERIGQQIAALFADRPRVYARSVMRAGPEHDAFSPPQHRSIAPRAGRRYGGPVAVLVGPGCLSSGEGMALMFQALPHATLIGQPTRGASGNPAPVVLPDGRSVFFSRWVAMDAEGRVIEGRGVAPDVESDRPYEAAIRMLSR